MSRTPRARPPARTEGASRAVRAGGAGRRKGVPSAGAFEKVGAVTPAGLQGAGPERAARLLIAMGAERASSILAALQPEEIEKIAAAIIRTPSVRASEAEELLAGIGASLDAVTLSGGPEVAREMLVAAFGEERAEALFHQVVPDAAPHFQFLNDVEPHQLRLLLKGESAAAISVILAHIDRSRAAEVLNELPSEQRAAVARRVARMGRLNRDAVVRVEEAVREKIRRQGRQVTQAVDGNETLASILRHMAPTDEGEILRDLEIVDPGLSRAVKERLYTTDLLLQLTERDLADLLREFDDRELALFIKGKSEELRALILKAVSERRRTIISEEFAHLGPRKRSDVDGITHELLERLRELEEDGTVLVPREGDRYI